MGAENNEKLCLVKVGMLRVCLLSIYLHFTIFQFDNASFAAKTLKGAKPTA